MTLGRNLIADRRDLVAKGVVRMTRMVVKPGMPRRT